MLEIIYSAIITATPKAMTENVHKQIIHERNGFNQKIKKEHSKIGVKLSVGAKPPTDNK